MRKFSARQRQILMFLLNRKNGVTAAEIADTISVSVRTVHRELDDLALRLNSYGLELYRKSGTGISIRLLGGEVPGEEAFQAFREVVLSVRPTDFSGEERLILLMCELLEAVEPVKMFALAHTMNVTSATISNDLDVLETELSKLKLTLIRRRGYGVEIEGEEEDIRAAIAQVASDELEYSDLIGNSSAKAGLVTRRLLQLAGKANLLQLEKTLWDMNWDWTEKLSEQHYTSLLIALSVMLSRVASGRVVRIQETDRLTESGEHQIMDEARQIAVALERGFGIQLPPGEIVHIARLFLAVRDDSPELASVDLEIMDIVERLIEEVVKRTGLPFHEDRSLRAGLQEHLNPALKRIREGARIRNPLLSAIRKDYEELFKVMRSSVNEIKGSLEVPDEEIGFLVMHFGASAERLSQLGRNVKAILVCSSGLSSSKLLATRLSREMPQIEVLRNVSWYEAARLPEEDYDLIISTINLPLPEDRYIRLSPLLSQEDMERLLAHIQSITLRERPASRQVDFQEDGALHRLMKLGNMFNEILALLKGFRLYELDNTDWSLEEILGEALELMNASGAPDEPGITADVPAVVQRLTDRERIATQMIPGTSLALFHTRSRFIQGRAISLFRLNQPLLLGQGEPVQVILLMLANRELSRESLEVLSEISSLLLKAEVVELLEIGSEGQIRNELAEEMLTFFENSL